ncbi:MAG TPA: DUF1064 domain-containing protein [Thermoguttaceae bacterium]|nr:DUF1064 domain-containing protein [Thermoguttaceae bacterium]
MPRINAKKARCGDLIFDSTGERDRYIELKELERRGDIRDLQCQPRFILQPRFKNLFTGKWVAAITYTADFQYVKWTKLQNGLNTASLVVEDWKGYLKREQRLSIKMFMFQHQDIEFVLTGPASKTKTGRKR